jgi:PadR family transcriptional regulator, regulatory protein PadR
MFLGHYGITLASHLSVPIALHERIRDYAQIDSCKLPEASNVIHHWTSQMSRGMFFAMAKGEILSADKSEVLQGTLDMMILKTLHALGPLHGFGIARRIEQVSEDVLTLNEGTVYTSLLRLQQQGWIESKWGTSENNRKARFYSITRRGRTQLAVETENWERISGVIGRVLRLEAEK